MIRKLKPFQNGLEGSEAALNLATQDLLYYLKSSRDNLPSYFVLSKFFSVLIELAHCIGMPLMIFYDNYAATFGVSGYCPVFNPTRGMGFPICRLPANEAVIVTLLALW